VIQWASVAVTSRTNIQGTNSSCHTKLHLGQAGVVSATPGKLAPLLNLPWLCVGGFRAIPCLWILLATWGPASSGCARVGGCLGPARLGGECSANECWATLWGPTVSHQSAPSC